MKHIKVKWNKVNPADLSENHGAQYYAFSRGLEMFHINEVVNDCLFTTVIQAAANLSLSIYELNIWVGFITEGNNYFGRNFDSSDIIEILKWSAKVELEESYEQELIATRA